MTNDNCAPPQSPWMLLADLHESSLWSLRFQRFWEQVVFVWCLEELEDLVRQTCGAMEDPDFLDSYAISGNAAAIDFFVALGRVTLDVHEGRRRIGRWRR